MSKTRQIPITQEMVMDAYKKVASNKGSAGVDQIGLETFKENLKDNLYKIWNRMTSGSYFPPAIKGVEIPKSNGKVRLLGIPTVGDRVAQQVVRDYLEPGLDSIFHEHSYGYRPGRKAHDAVKQVWKNCWDYAWVLDIDIKSFFDEIDHDLLIKALTRHVSEKWVKVYVERWLKAPLKMGKGDEIKREKGTPQGGVISPLLANLFLHYAFDKWMEIHLPEIPFERYADDIVIHCKNETQANQVLARVNQRFTECKLTLHPEKTKIVYCKGGNRKGIHPEVSFTFLGFTFCPRKNKPKGNANWGTHFLPSASKEAKRKLNDKIKSLVLHRQTKSDIFRIAEEINVIVRGWLNYFSDFGKSYLSDIFRTLNRRIEKWIRWRYKRLRWAIVGAKKWLNRFWKIQPELFVHWKAGFIPEIVTA